MAEDCPHILYKQILKIRNMPSPPDEHTPEKHAHKTDANSNIPNIPKRKIEFRKHWKPKENVHFNNEEKARTQEQPKIHGKTFKEL